MGSDILPLLRMMTGPVQHFRSAILDAWRFRVFSWLSERKGFLGGEFSDFQGSLQLLSLVPPAGTRGPFCVGVFGTDSLLARPRRKTFLVDYVAKRMVMVTCFGSVLSPPFSTFGIFLSLLHLFFWIVSNWPRCLLWHGWLPGLSGISDKDPLATSFGYLASFHLERCLGAYPVDFASCWTPPEYWDADDIALEVSEYPNIWTDGSSEVFSSLGGFEVAGAGVYLPASELAFDGSVWGTTEEYGDAPLERCRAFMPVPVVMQIVQRAEFWGAVLAMQAYWPCHLGIDNLDVAGEYRSSA